MGICIYIHIYIYYIYNIYIISHDIQKNPAFFPWEKPWLSGNFPVIPMVSEAEPKAKMVAGNTEVGIETKHPGGMDPWVIHI